MASSRWAAVILIVGLGSLAMPASIHAQDLTEADKKQQVAFGKIQDLLEQLPINTKPFHAEMPLAKFLEEIEMQLPKDKKISLRLDREAFGKKSAEVANAPIVLPEVPRKISLRTALLLAYSQLPVKVDYRTGAGEIMITTPARALFTIEHDIRDLVTRPEAVGINGAAFRNADQAKRAALLVKRIVSLTELSEPVAPETIEVRNGTRLSIRTVGTRHAEFAQTLRAFSRLADIDVSSQAKLYEVDEAFYTKLKNAKRIDWDAEERAFLEGKPLPSPYQGLSKQKLILTGDEVRVGNGHAAALLSRQEVRQCLSSPEQVRKGDKGRQSFTTGISFNADIAVTPDRRYLRVKLTEKAVELQEIQKVKVVTAAGAVFEEFAVQVKENPWKEVVAEVPVLIESSQTQMVDVPDGGTILIPVQHRPRSLQENKRWLVLSITSRIIMEEEERRILLNEMHDAIPALVADVLTNPRLKTTRDYCGTPGDKRFALVDSESWNWPKEFHPKVGGFELTPAKAAGKRLLGIRVDRYVAASSLAIRVTLVNAGGSDNGAAIGGCSLSYNARHGDKEWRVELQEP